MTHPFKAQAKTGQAMAKSRGYADGGSTPSVQPITPTVADNFQRAIRNAGSDEESGRLANVALKRYGVKIK